MRIFSKAFVLLIALLALSEAWANPYFVETMQIRMANLEQDLNKIQFSFSQKKLSTFHYQPETRTFLSSYLNRMKNNLDSEQQLQSSTLTEIEQAEALQLPLPQLRTLMGKKTAEFQQKMAAGRKVVLNELPTGPTENRDQTKLANTSLLEIYEDPLQGIHQSLLQLKELLQTAQEKFKPPFSKQAEILLGRIIKAEKLHQKIHADINKTGEDLQRYLEVEAEFKKKMTTEFHERLKQFKQNDKRLFLEEVAIYLKGHAAESFDNSVTIKSEREKWDGQFKNYQDQRNNLLSQFLKDKGGQLDDYPPIREALEKQITAIHKTWIEFDKDLGISQQKLKDFLQAGQMAIQKRNEKYQQWVALEFHRKRVNEFIENKSQAWNKTIDERKKNFQDMVFQTREKLHDTHGQLFDEHQKWLKEQHSLADSELTRDFNLPESHLTEHRIDKNAFEKTKEYLHEQLLLDQVTLHEKLNQPAEKMINDIVDLAASSTKKFDERRDQANEAIDQQLKEKAQVIQAAIQKVLKVREKELQKIFDIEWQDWPMTAPTMKNYQDKRKDRPVDKLLVSMSQEIYADVKDLVAEITQKVAITDNPDEKPMASYDTIDHQQALERIGGNIQREIDETLSEKYPSQKELSDYKKKAYTALKYLKEEYGNHENCLKSLDLNVLKNSPLDAVYKKFHKSQKGLLARLGDALKKDKNAKHQLAPGQTITCLSCLDDAGPHVIPFYCKHGFCKDGGCFEQYFSMISKEKRDVICPHIDEQSKVKCQSGVDYAFARQMSLIPDKPLFAQRCQDYLTLVSSDPHWVPCKTPNCQGGGINHDSATTRFECPMCNYNFCKKCPHPHDKFTSCAEYEKYLQSKDVDPLKEQKEKGFVKKCPNPSGCDQWISKGEGCLHMKCNKCKYDFNWENLKKWDGTAYWRLENGNNIDPNIDTNVERRKEIR